MHHILRMNWIHHTRGCNLPASMTVHRGAPVTRRSVAEVRQRRSGSDGSDVGAVLGRFVLAHASKKNSLSNSARAIRVGFVALADAAPLLVAHECGYFADEGLLVSLERQIGWGNVRDKLVYGHLHASHALFGMPPLSVLRHERFSEPLVCIVALGPGKNGITLSRIWTDVGVDSAATLGQRLRTRLNDVPVFAHVFGCSI